MIHPVGSDWGITHFFTATRNTTEGVWEKEQTNEQYGLKSAPSVRRVVLWQFFCTAFRASCRLLQRVYFSRNSYRSHKECQLILDWLPSLPPSAGHPTLDCWLILTGPFCCPFSTASLRLSSPSDPLWIPLPTAPLASLGPRFPHFRSRRRSRAKTDKRIVCLADHPHSVTPHTHPKNLSNNMAQMNRFLNDIIKIILEDLKFPCF